MLAQIATTSVNYFFIHLKCIIVSIRRFCIKIKNKTAARNGKELKSKISYLQGACEDPHEVSQYVAQHEICVNGVAKTS
jgi:hypothetical protein